MAGIQIVRNLYLAERGGVWRNSRRDGAGTTSRFHRLKHAHVIWTRSANSRIGQRLSSCRIEGRTDGEIAKLRFQLARYRRAEFGRSSEKLAREAEQLELAIEALEADQAERLAAASPVVAAASRPPLKRKSRPGARCRGTCRARR